MRDATFTIDSVVVTVTNGGSGTLGGTGDAGAAGGGGCSADSGVIGAKGGDAPPAASGSFARDGYVPATGLSGSADGGLGTSGTCAVAPDNGNLHPATVCAGCLSICVNSISGCGGGPGAGGLGGEGGGSSIAVFAWNANVTVNGGSFQSGNGGGGGNGGSGGSGGVGGNGTSVSTPYCSCSIVNDASACGCPGGLATATTGATGAAGGIGGHGGGGAGGYSYAIFSGGDAGSVTLTNEPALSHGDPGLGGLVSGPTGQAADRGP